MTVTVQHTWPWRRAEQISIAALAVLGPAFTLLTGGSAWWAAPAGLAAAYACFRTGRSRKTRSSVTATIDGDRLTVTSQGELGKSAVRLTKVESVGLRRFGSDDTLVLAGGGSSARVPVRLSADPRIASLIGEVVARAEITAEAREWLARAPLSASGTSSSGLSAVPARPAALHVG